VSGKYVEGMRAMAKMKREEGLIMLAPLIWQNGLVPKYHKCRQGTTIYSAEFFLSGRPLLTPSKMCTRHVFPRGDITQKDLGERFHQTLGWSYGSRGFHQELLGGYHVSR
jgi:hypothetical protein